MSTNLLFVILPLKEKKWSYKITCCLCVNAVFVWPFQILNQLASFHRTLVECYAVGGHHNSLYLNFMQSVITW